MEKEYTKLLKAANEELETANGSLEKLEKKYQRSGMQNAELQYQIRNYKETKANLKKNIKEYEAKLYKIKKFNDEIMPMLENLKSNIKNFVRGVADLTKAFDEEILRLGKENEELKKENDELKKAHVEELAKRDKMIAKKDRILSKKVETLLLEILENDNSYKELGDTLKQALLKNLEIDQKEISESKADFENKNTSKEPNEHQSNGLEEITSKRKIKGQTVSFKKLGLMYKKII